MENNSLPERKAKPAKPSQSVALNIRRETKKRIQAELAKINKKDLGRSILADDYVALAITLVTPDHVRQLQDASLTNADRLQRDYREYIAKFGHVTIDQYLGLLMSGKLQEKAQKPQDDSESKQ